MSQMKKRDKTPENELNEMEASNLHFKTLDIGILNEHMGRIDEISGNLHKQVETITLHFEMKSTITELKTTLDGMNSRLDEAEDSISDLEDKVSENTQSEEQKDKRIFKNEDGLQDFWDNI